MDTLTRRLAGTAAAILLVAGMFAVYQLFSRPPAGSYEVVAELGDAGAGLNLGTDVKVRGVDVGSVSGIDYRDATAFATLRLDPRPRLPAPGDVSVVVTAKTLLGEKQVELRVPDGRLGSGPYLQDGDRLAARGRPVELAAVFDELVPLLEAVPAADLASLVEALSAQRGTGEQIGANIRLGQRLSAFNRRVADENLANLRRLADVSGAVADRAGDFNRLNDLAGPATSLLPDRQAAVRANLDRLRSFAAGFAGLLEVEQATIGRLLATGDRVGRVLECRAPQIGTLVDGLFKYTSLIGKGGGFLTDGTEYAFFRILIDMTSQPALPGLPGDGEPPVEPPGVPGQGDDGGSGQEDAGGGPQELDAPRLPGVVCG